MKRDSVSNLDKKDVRRKWLVRSILSLIRFNERSMHLHRFNRETKDPSLRLQESRAPLTRLRMINNDDLSFRVKLELVF